MTDRVNALTVTVILEKDSRDDDILGTINAIKQMRGVLDVQINVVGITDAIADTRARAELREKLLEVIRSL